jgi:uncharacterized protein (TIGR01777 family)
MKRIVIAGGTGLIGNKLSELLINNGYEVLILTRNPNNYKSNNDKIKYGKLDLNNVNSTAELLNGSYSIINLAGAGIADKKWTAEYKNSILKSRIDTTNHLTNAINKIEKLPESFISASAIGIYGDRADEKLNEKSKTAHSFLADVCTQWELSAENCNPKVRLVKARIGVVLSENGGALPKMSLPFKLFVGGPIGSGKQWMSWIHIDDICNMFLWTIENNQTSGIINFTAPNPVTMNEFAKKIGIILGRPSFFKVPEFVIKFILGESAEMVLASQRVFPSAAEHLGYRHKFAYLDEALTDILK